MATYHEAGKPGPPLSVDYLLSFLRHQMGRGQGLESRRALPVHVPVMSRQINGGESVSALATCEKWWGTLRRNKARSGQPSGPRGGRRPARRLPVLSLLPPPPPRTAPSRKLELKFTLLGGGGRGGSHPKFILSNQ